MKNKVHEIVKQIKSSDKSFYDEALLYQDTLAMPPMSLGKLQLLACQLCSIKKTLHPHAGKKRIVVMCSDNGVVKQGVASAPQSVTAMQAVNMTKYKTGMSCIAKSFGVDLKIVDVGIACDYNCDKIINRKIRPGTSDISVGPAMTEDELYKAVYAGIEQAQEAYKDGIDVIGSGEMGIGNTTTSSAVLCALTGLSVETVTGRGGGLTLDGLKNKCAVIKKSLETNVFEKENAFDVLQKLGGFDLVAMCGLFWEPRFTKYRL